jgi:hypothetical protein
MLNGTYDSSALDDLTSLFVSHFERLTASDILPSSITSKEMMDKYKYWPESTTTSPSGRHLGHYRALLPNICHDKNTKKEEVERQRAALVSVHHALLSYALTHGHSFARWQKVVNVMIEKEPGKTLEEVKYHLKTQLGVSEDHYKHYQISPVYGTGQGSGNSPTVWLVISSILFICYSEKAHVPDLNCLTSLFVWMCFEWDLSMIRRLMLTIFYRESLL